MFGNLSWIANNTSHTWKKSEKSEKINFLQNFGLYLHRHMIDYTAFLIGNFSLPWGNLALIDNNANRTRAFSSLFKKVKKSCEKHLQSYHSMIW
jgi:hypothetical protein